MENGAATIELIAIRGRPGLARMIRMAFLAGALACGGDAPPEPDPSSRRTVLQGRLIGYAGERETHAWKGIPFASPPVGLLRWRAPQPPTPWPGELLALRAGAACVQLETGLSPVGATSEDCLFLDVYAPRFGPDSIPEGEAKLPVMVWIHGGANAMGEASMYDGVHLAADGSVVVVSIQYRLGVLGWFSHRALRARAASRADASGNFGTLDQIRALEWVRENIAAFGGDPDNVTIFGESAGGTNVQALLRAPLANGLFHRAISQSGRLRGVTRAEAENCVDAADPGQTGSSCEVVAAHLVRDGMAPDRDAAVKRSERMGDAEIEALLRSKTSADLLAIYRETLGPIYPGPRIFRDGFVVSALDPVAALSTPGEHNAVPTLLGSNRDETRLLSLMKSPYVDRWFGIPVGLDDAFAFKLSGEYGAGFWRANGVDLAANALAGAGRGDVFGYRFDWDEEGSLLFVDLGELLGASHLVDVLFVFGFTDLGEFTDNVFPTHESAVALSRQMRSYWTQFAYTGTPDRGRDGSLPEWEPWRVAPGAPKSMLFDTVAGGGLRMSNNATEAATLLAEVARDARFASIELRCEILRELERFHRSAIRPSYATLSGGMCAAFPLDPVWPLKVF